MNPMQPHRPQTLADKARARIETPELEALVEQLNGRDNGRTELEPGEDHPPRGAVGFEPTRSTLPPDRQKAVEYGIAQFQQVAHERDELRKEVAAMRERIAALEIEAEGLRGHVNDAQSKITTALLVRDQALADRIVYETLFVSIQAQMRAFAVPAAPLVNDADGAPR